MAKPFLCKVGIAQISANPAYADELVSTIQEPVFPGKDEKIGLFTIAGLDEVNALRQRIAERYVLHLNHKVEAVIRFAGSRGVKLVVFPEYSIPPESLQLCKMLSDELDIAVIAGSHVVTVNPNALRIYEELGLRIQGHPEGSEIDSSVRQSICVALVPGQHPLAFPKLFRAKGEQTLVSGTSGMHSFSLDLKAGKLEVQVLICIEALSATPSTKEKHTHSRLIAIPAYSPTLEPFYDVGRLALIQGKCSLFSNIAEFGGSKIFARAETANLWFTGRDGTSEVPQFSESLLTAEVDLEKQFEVRRSTQLHTAVSDIRVYPLLYALNSAEATQYAELLNAVGAADFAIDELGRRVEPFTTLTSKVFPKFLQEKLTHFVSHVVPVGSVNHNEAREWIQPVLVLDTPSTDIVRWELCNDAIDRVNQLQLSGKYVGKGKELAQVYAHLVSKRNDLLAFIQPPQKSAVPVVRTPMEPKDGVRSSESPFIDRQHAFDKIRAFMSQQEVAFVLSGMRGMGKSALIQEAFRQAIPPRRSISIKLTEGISYPRLLAELAFGFNLRIPEHLDLSTPEKLSELEQRVLSHVSRGPAAVIVLDDFQQLLNNAGEIESLPVKELLLGLLEASLKSKTKLFFISDLAPRFSPDVQAYCAPYKLQGLISDDTKRLLLYWFQFGREDLSGQPPEPSARTISLLGGHPLATKVAAQLWAEHPSQDISEDMMIFERLRDTIVPFILEKISLSSAETELLLFASIFRLPVSRDAFLKWKGDEAGYLLSSLASQYLIESSERGYELHPLVRDFFYHKLPITKSMELHRIAGKFYSEMFDKARVATRQLVPEYLGEAVHHFLAGGDRKRVQSLAFYGQELKPVALSHYRRREYKMAMKDYLVLAELDDKDVDAHFHLALLHARNENWNEAEFHYGKAIELRPRAPWIIQGYANAKLRAGKVAEAEQLLSEAADINPRHPATLVDLGRIRERQGQLADAEEYYRRAIDANPEYSFAYYQLAYLLYNQGEIPEAYEMAKAAMATQPLDSKNKSLVQELKKKMEAASRPRTATGTAPAS